MLAIKKVNTPLLLQAIARVEILDARPDDYCLGFMRMEPEWTDQEENMTAEKQSLELFNNYQPITTKEPLKEIWKNQLVDKSLIGSDTGMAILICLRECWFFENDMDANPSSGATVKMQLDNSGLLLRADVYIKKDEKYIPLTRIDSFFHAKKPLEKEGSLLMLDAINSLADKINRSNPADVSARATRFKTRTTIDSFYAQLHQIPAAFEMDTASQYIIEDWQAFKTKRFTPAHLRYKTDKLGDYFYNKENDGNESLVGSFGVIKGGNLYVRTNNTFSKAFVHNNRIFTIGTKMIAKRKIYNVPILIPTASGLLVSTPIRLPINSGWLGNPIGTHAGTKNRRYYQPLMLDMDTEDFF